jgi:FMN reductase
MSLIVTLSGSPSSPSRSQELADLVGARLREAGFEVSALNVRDLPATSLLQARVDDPEIQAALALIARADGVVLVTPLYKAAYTGVLKSFLDLLPQFGLAGKVALPLATGGTVAHVLAIDYALRPVLAALAAAHVTTGLFLLDKQLERQPEVGLRVEPELLRRLHVVIDEFTAAVARLRAGADSLLPGQQPSSNGAAAREAAPA